MEYIGAAIGAGIFSLLAGYALFKLLRIRGVVKPWIAGALAACGSIAAVAALNASSGTSDPIVWLAGVSAPGALIGTAMAWNADRKGAVATGS